MMKADPFPDRPFACTRQSGGIAPSLRKITKPPGSILPGGFCVEALGP
jgi:hypothetical protein